MIWKMSKIIVVGIHAPCLTVKVDESKKQDFKTLEWALALLQNETQTRQKCGHSCHRFQDFPKIQEISRRCICKTPGHPRRNDVGRRGRLYINNKCISSKIFLGIIPKRRSWLIPESRTNEIWWVVGMWVVIWRKKGRGISDLSSEMFCRNSLKALSNKELNLHQAWSWMLLDHHKVTSCCLSSFLYNRILRWWWCWCWW